MNLGWLSGRSQGGEVIFLKASCIVGRVLSLPGRFCGSMILSRAPHRLFLELYTEMATFVLWQKLTEASCLKQGEGSMLRKPLELRQSATNYV